MSISALVWIISIRQQLLNRHPCACITAICCSSTVCTKSMISDVATKHAYSWPGLWRTPKLRAQYMSCTVPISTMSEAAKIYHGPRSGLSYIGFTTMQVADMLFWVVQQACFCLDKSGLLSLLQMPVVCITH